MMRHTSTMCYFKGSDCNDGHLSMAAFFFLNLFFCTFSIHNPFHCKTLAYLNKLKKTSDFSQNIATLSVIRRFDVHFFKNFSVTEVTAENLKTATMPRSYHSPWEQEILGDPNLADTVNLIMPAPEPRPNLPEYKCFNR